jgi:hypothetical protein
MRVPGMLRRVEEAELQALDDQGFTVVNAVAHVKAPPQASLASPHAFACMDGQVYWGAVATVSIPFPRPRRLTTNGSRPQDGKKT